MITIDPTVSLTATLTQALRVALRKANSQFAKQPNAQNWDDVQLAMLAWQQWDYAMATSRTDIHTSDIAEEALFIPGDTVRMMTVVVTEVTGMTPREILR